MKCLVNLAFYFHILFYISIMQKIGKGQDNATTVNIHTALIELLFYYSVLLLLYYYFLIFTILQSHNHLIIPCEKIGASVIK